MAIVGSGPGCLDNKPGFIDGAHDIVVRVNNYKLTPETGRRTDIFYSFFGNSIRKTSDELIRDGVTICICKCPNAHVINSDWHHRRNRMNGVDFRYIYQNRANWWFCDTYIPAAEEFLETFQMLGRHVPTTGFAAILFILSCDPKSVYLTGFDFFQSKVHNVDEPWRGRNLSDPIGHAPDREMAWIIANRERFSFDPGLTQLMQKYERAA